MATFITTFARSEEFLKARTALEELSLSHEVIDPGPGYSQVGIAALIVDEAVRMQLYAHRPDAFTCAGWIDYYPSSLSIPQQPTTFEEDLFGRAAIMVLQPCAADPKKIRATAHLSGDLSPAFPYMNAVMPNASYNAEAQTLTYMEGHRIITIYPHRIAMAKADDIVDGWRVLESIRVKANQCWAERASIKPSYTMRSKPPALEIYFRLPKINCGKCGEKACMAFALKVWNGSLKVQSCLPVFAEGKYDHLKEPLLQIGA